MADKSNVLTLPAKPEPHRRIATTRDGRDITRGFVGAGVLQHSYANSVLLRRGSQNLRVYEEVLRDDQVKTCIEQRIRAVVRAEWRVDAAGESAADTAAAEALAEDMKRIGWDRVTELMLYCRFYGYSVAELIWQPDAERMNWEQIKVRDRSRFRFDVDMTLRLLTNSNVDPGEEAAPPYFWWMSAGATHDDEPYGIGLAHWCYWPTYFKRFGIRSWSRYLEKYATPTAVGKYPASAGKEEQDKLLQAARAMQQDAGVIIPDDMMLELMQAAYSAGADYHRKAEYMDDQISKIILGQTMTTKDGSSRSQSETHLSVRQDIVAADADLINESFRCGPALWWRDYNFPSAEVPEVVREMEEPEDLCARADRDTKLKEMGYHLEPEAQREVYGDGYVFKEPQTPPALGGNDDNEPEPGEDGLEFAEGDDRTRAQELTDQLGDEAGAGMDELITSLSEVWESGESFEDLLLKLSNAFPQAKITTLAHAVQNGIAAAEVAGRHDALDDSGEL